MLPEEDNNEPIGMLVLVRGLDASGEPQFAYAAIYPEKYEAFLNAEASGAYDLSAFGTILYYGRGKEPPLEVQREMEKKYGANHNFQNAITDAIEALASDDAQPLQ